MNDISDEPDRLSRLDRFATATAEPGRALIPAMAFNPAGGRIIGAQAVAVYRDEARVLAKVRALAAAAGDDWYYRFPVKNRRENRTDWIEGPSIKLANDLARLYGNCDVDVQVTDIGDAWLIYARFTDFETGFSLSRPFQQRKSGARIGGEDDARRLDISLQIGASKAIRNTIVNALQTYADFAFQEAKNALVSKIGHDLPSWRRRTADRLREHVAVERVERVVGRTVEEWLAPDIARVIAMMKAVTDGMASLDETFPPIEAPKETATAELNRFAETPSGVGLEPWALAAEQFRRSVEADAAADMEALTAAPKRRGRPPGSKTRPKAEADAEPDEESPRDAPQGAAAASAAHPPTPRPEAAPGPSSGPDEAISPREARRPDLNARDESAESVANDLLAALHRTGTKEEFDSAVAVGFRQRIKSLPGDDRLDVGAIGNIFARWRAGDLTEEQRDFDIEDRLRLIRRRADAQGGKINEE